jgi:hypothetical protein
VLVVIGKPSALYKGDDCFLLNAPAGFEKDAITVYVRGLDGKLGLMK